MYPNLKVGDYLFVSKILLWFFTFLPLSLPLYFQVESFMRNQKRGDIVVFKTPEDNRTDYIKRLIGKPGDKIKMVSNEIFVNDKKISTKFIANEQYKFMDVKKKKKLRRDYKNNKSYYIYEFMRPFIDLDTNNFSEVTVPVDHFFVLGDNRDNSQDSRYIGFIPKNNLVGRAEIVFLSFDTEIGSFFKFWTWFPCIKKR